jgi:hypothetical protein
MAALIVYITLLAVNMGMSASADKAVRSGDRSGPTALNMIAYQQGAVRYVQANGGSGYAGPIPAAGITVEMPSWFRIEGPWSSYGAGGIVVTWPSAPILGVTQGRLLAMLVDISDNDVEIGYVASNIFYSASGPYSSAMPIAIPDNTPVYVSRMN